MCGMAGALLRNAGGVPDRELRRRATAMARILHHRGPDGYGVWADPHVTLAHTRLAIIDTSTSANQPMHDATDTVHIVFNGEIYNFMDLRAQLQGPDTWMGTVVPLLTVMDSFSSPWARTRTYCTRQVVIWVGLLVVPDVKTTSHGSSGPIDENRALKSVRVTELPRGKKSANAIAPSSASPDSSTVCSSAGSGTPAPESNAG